MSLRRFIQCDVFTPTPIKGNGLAVVVDGDEISDETMQNFAAWTNLAETTFIQGSNLSEVDYKLRIFTPKTEMLFAGHPTLGSCAAWLHAGGRPKQPGVVRQECGVGIVDIDISNPVSLAFTAPPTAIRAMDVNQFDAIRKALDLPEAAILDTAELDNGPVWQAFRLDSADRVKALDWVKIRRPDFSRVGFVGAHPPGHECDYEVRHLAPTSGMPEDPITGSLNSALAHWFQKNGLLTESVRVAQGTCIGRHGRVSWQPVDSENLKIGGQTHILIEGMVEL